MPGRVVKTRWPNYEACEKCGAASGHPCVPLKKIYTSDRYAKQPHTGRKRKDAGTKK